MLNICFDDYYLTLTHLYHCQNWWYNNSRIGSNRVMWPTFETQNLLHAPAVIIIE